LVVSNSKSAFRVLGLVSKVVCALSSLSFAMDTHCLRGWVTVDHYVVCYRWLARFRIFQFWVLVTIDSTAWFRGLASRCFMSKFPASVTLDKWGPV